MLTKNGYTLLKKNYRSKYGEIDIVAEKNSILTFIEVKVSDYMGRENLEYSINPIKRMHIINTAKDYLAHNKISREKQVRFDVILFQNNYKNIHHIENAF
jgi:putative endonuclease